MNQLASTMISKGQMTASHVQQLCVELANFDPQIDWNPSMTRRVLFGRCGREGDL